MMMMMVMMVMMLSEKCNPDLCRRGPILHSPSKLNLQNQQQAVEAFPKSGFA